MFSPPLHLHRHFGILWPMLKSNFLFLLHSHSVSFSALSMPVYAARQESCYTFIHDLNKFALSLSLRNKYTRTHSSNRMEMNRQCVCVCVCVKNERKWQINTLAYKQQYKGFYVQNERNKEKYWTTPFQHYAGVVRCHAKLVWRCILNDRNDQLGRKIEKKRERQLLESFEWAEWWYDLICCQQILRRWTRIQGTHAHTAKESQAKLCWSAIQCTCTIDN